MTDEQMKRIELHIEQVEGLLATDMEGNVYVYYEIE